MSRNKQVMTFLAAALLAVSPIHWQPGFAAANDAGAVQLAQRDGGGGRAGGGAGGGGGGRSGGAGATSAPSSPSGGRGLSGGIGGRSGGGGGSAPAAAPSQGGGGGGERGGRANAGNRGGERVGDRVQPSIRGGGERGYRHGGGERSGARDAAKSRERGRDAVRASRPIVERQAQPSDRRQGDGGRSARPQRHDRAYIRQRGQRFNWSPGIAFWFYDGYYYGDCDWLRRKARETGSAYWLRRYRQCRAW